MSKLGKLRKNAEKYNLDSIYNNMTPEQYRQSIKIAVQKATEDLAREYDKQLHKLQEDFNMQIKQSVHITMDTFSIEFLYELANRLDCFADEPEYMEQKIDLVQGVYENIMKSIEDYANVKNDDKVYKQFKKKKELIQKVFNIYKD